MSTTYKTEKKKHKKESEATPKYDLVSVEARKYIVGGAAVFIPDLCEALKQDWYPRASYEEIRKTPELKDQIKGKVANEWCTERTADKIGWSYFTIWSFWPEWLEEPHTGETKQEKETYQAYRHFMRQVTKKKTDLDNLINTFPEVPPRPEEDKTGSPHNQKPDTPEQIYNDTMYAYGRIWERLFNYGDAPGPTTDLESRVLAPSEKYRLRLLKGLGPDERAQLINQSSYLHTCIVGFLKHAKNVLAQETRVEK